MFSLYIYQFVGESEGTFILWTFYVHLESVLNFVKNAPEIYFKTLKSLFGGLFGQKSKKRKLILDVHRKFKLWMCTPFFPKLSRKRRKNTITTFQEDLNPKKAYFGGFWDKNQKNENWFLMYKKSSNYKCHLRFFQNCFGKS